MKDLSDIDFYQLQSYMEMFSCNARDGLLVLAINYLCEERDADVLLQDLDCMGFTLELITESFKRLKSGGLIYNFCINDGFVYAEPNDILQLILFTQWKEDFDCPEELVNFVDKHSRSEKYIYDRRGFAVVRNLGYVYLMQNKRNAYIKIGYTKNPPKFREKTLQSEEPEIELLKSFRGSWSDEQKLHLIFKEKRLRGEWFKLNDSDVSQVEAYFN